MQAEHDAEPAPQSVVRVELAPTTWPRGSPAAETPMVRAAPVWPLVAYFGLVLVVLGSMLGVSALLGQRHREHATGEPYESGIVSTGSARLRFSSRFYLVAMFFVIFDLEAAFIFAWAVAAKEAGWLGYAEVVVFVVILAAALVYLWRLGALDFGPRARTEAARRGRRRPA